MKKSLFLMCLLFCACNADINFVIEKDEHIELTHADSAEYDENIIKLYGNIEIKYGNKIIKSDSIHMHSVNKDIKANGNIQIEDEFGNQFTADSIVIKGGLKNCFLNKVKLILDDKSHLYADDALFSNDKYFNMNNAEYSPCYECVFDDKLTWKIKADQVKQKNDEIIYKNAIFYMFDVPVMYLPYFSQPAIHVKRKSGFLLPLFSTSSTSGASVCVRYLYSISNSQELILKPIITSKIGNSMWATYGYRFNSGLFEIDASATGVKSISNIDLTKIEKLEADEISKIKHNNWRGHVFLKFRYDINEHYRAFSDINFVSDKYYLKRFPFLYDDEKRLLESNVGFERFVDNDYTTLKLLFFQSLRPEENTNFIPRAFPLLSHNFIYETVFGRLSVDLFAMHLDFISDHSTNKSFVNLGLEKDLILNNGNVISLNFKILSSLNSISYKKNLGKNSTLIDTSPLLGLTWKWPWLLEYKNGISAILQPVVGIVLTTKRKTNSVFDDPYTSLPFFELNGSNFLDVNRNPFSSQINDGSRIPYGFIMSMYSFGRQVMNMSIGRSLNISNIKNCYGELSDIKNKHSNVITNIDIFPTKYSSIFFANSYSTKTHSSPRFEVGGKYENDKFAIKTSVFRYNTQHVENFIKYNGCHFDCSVKINKQFSVNGELIFGSNSNNLLKKSLGMSYQNECFSANIKFSHHRFRTGDVKPNKSVAIVLVFKNLGKLDYRI